MQIAPFNYIKRSKNYDASKWPLSCSTSISPQADLMVHLPQIRDDHVKYISELARYSNEVKTDYFRFHECILLHSICTYLLTYKFRLQPLIKKRELM